MSHDHDFAVTPIERAPRPEEGGHTAFMLLSCRCGHAEVFPLSNYLLTTPAFQHDFEGRLAAEGLTLDRRPPTSGASFTIDASDDGGPRCYIGVHKDGRVEIDLSEEAKGK